MQRPNHPQPLGQGAARGQPRIEQPRRAGVEPPCRGPFLEQPAGMAGEPVVVVAQHAHEGRVAFASQLDRHRLRLRSVVHHLEDPPVGPVVAAVVAAVALVPVVPVEDDHLAIGANLQRDELRPGVVGEQEVGLAVADVARADRGDLVLIQPGTVDVVHEQFSAKPVRPRAAEVEAGAGVGMATSRGIRGLPVRLVPLAADPMPVAGDRLDVVERPRVEVLASLPLVAAALDHVVEMRDHAGRGEGIADLVEVDPPGITCALREHLELVPHRVIPPDAGVELHAIAIGRARLADG